MSTNFNDYKIGSSVWFFVDEHGYPVCPKATPLKTTAKQLRLIGKHESLDLAVIEFPSGFANSISYVVRFGVPDSYTGNLWYVDSSMLVQSETA